MISTAFAAIVAGGCYFLGGFGRLYSDKVDVASQGYDAIIPTMLSGLPTFLIAVVVILVLSASMSTLSSLVLTSSSTLTLDFIQGNLIKHMGEKQKLRWMRALVVVFIAISVVLAIIQYRSSVTFIAQLMGISWGALAGAFLAPFLYGLYWSGLQDPPVPPAFSSPQRSCWPTFWWENCFLPFRLFPHQLRSLLYAGRFGAGAFGQPLHFSPGQPPGGKNLFLLRSDHHRHLAGLHRPPGTEKVIPFSVPKKSGTLPRGSVPFGSALAFPLSGGLGTGRGVIIPECLLYYCLGR